MRTSILFFKRCLTCSKTPFTANGMVHLRKNIYICTDCLIVSTALIADSENKELKYNFLNNLNKTINKFLENDDHKLPTNLGEPLKEDDL